MRLYRNTERIIKIKLEKKLLKRFSRMMPDEDRTAICAPIVYYDSQFYDGDSRYKDYVTSVWKEFFGFDETERRRTYYWHMDHSRAPSVVRGSLSLQDAQDFNTPNSLDSGSIISKVDNLNCMQ